MKSPVHINLPHTCFPISLAITLSITGLIFDLNSRILEGCRNTSFSFSRTDITPNISFLKCNIHYEKFEGSVISNKSNNLIECTVDIQARVAHILPPISYMLQLHTIYDLCSFRGEWRYILRSISWIIALFIFIIIAIGTHGTTCLYYHTTQIVCISGLFLSGVVLVIHYYDYNKYVTYKRHRTCRKRRSRKNKHNRKSLSTVIVM
jgi:hypothetical protein